MGFGHGHGHGVMRPSQGVGGVGQPPTSLSDYIMGVDASSYVDPGGLPDRLVVNTPVTNLAPGGTALTPHFDPQNLPILHTGDWVRDADTVPGPGAGDWFSVNKGSRDSSFALKTEWELDFTTPPGPTDGISGIMGIYVTTLSSGVWLSPYYCSAERTAMLVTTGRIDCVSNDATKTNLVLGGGSAWTQGDWHLWAFSQGEDFFETMFDGVEATYNTSPVGLGGLMTPNLCAWGTAPDCGVACLHLWNNNHTMATMRPVMAYLADKHGLPYTP